MHLVLLLVIFNHWVAGFSKCRESLLDAFDIIVATATRLAAFHETLEHFAFGTVKEENEFTFTDLELEVGLPTMSGCCT